MRRGISGGQEKRLTTALLVESGKFLLSVKRIRRTTYTEYVISMRANTISRSSNTYIGKIRSNFLGTKFIIYDTSYGYGTITVTWEETVFGTTSELTFLDSVGICDSFSVTYSVPTLKTEDAKKVLQQLNLFSEDDVDAAADALNDMPIKKLYMLLEMAAQGEHGGSAEAIYAGREKSKSLISLIAYKTSFGSKNFKHIRLVLHWRDLFKTSFGASFNRFWFCF